MLHTKGKLIRGKPHVVFVYNPSYLSVDALTGDDLIVVIIFEDANIFSGKIDRLVQLQGYRFVSISSRVLEGPDHGFTLFSAHMYMMCNLRTLSHLHMAVDAAVGSEGGRLELAGIPLHSLRMGLLH